MRFVAEYVHREGTHPNYYRTIFEDSINLAIKVAERWTRKGFICKRVTQQFNGAY